MFNKVVCINDDQESGAMKMAYMVIETLRG
jgi:hypothetical protein